MNLEQYVRPLDSALRRHIAERWLSTAQAEHASIAAFNRFSLQLLAVGAPAELLEACQRATLDEIRHARLCFGIASVYAGTALGPGELPIGREVMTGFDLEGVVRGTIEEGCIGETLASLEAQAARDLAEHDTIKSALEVISKDESTHAELAFQAVRWGLEVRPELLDIAREVYDQTLERHRHDHRPHHTRESELGRHGVLPESERRRVRAQAFEEVLLPARAALLA